MDLVDVNETEEGQEEEEEVEVALEGRLLI